ncbi:MAG: ABC transporter permease [Actinobacteria bacterium]|nr:ABC transporter permease [Actinomycetota bacterium]
MPRGLPQLTLASARMIYRSPASLRVAFLTPLMFAALIALFHQLRFETGSRSIDFFSYLATGVAFWYVTYAAEHGMTGAAAGYRAQGVLKRVAATPISAGTFIGAQLLARMGVAIAQTIVVLGAARLLGADIKLGASFLWELVPVTMIVVAALSLGFIWAGITRTPGGANTLDIMALIPLLYLTGGLFPRDAFSPAVQAITEYAIPFAPMFDMLRGIALQGVGIEHFGRELIVAAAWVVALFLIATRAYRLREE